MTSKSKLVLMATGVYINNRLSQAHKDSLKKIGADQLQSLLHGEIDWQIEAEDDVLAQLNKLDFDTESGLVQASPEIKSLAKIGIDENDNIELFSSETKDGILAARITMQFIQSKWHSTVNIQVVEGLQMDSPGQFRSRGVPNYVRGLVRLLEDPSNKHGRDIVLNATAGYKSLVPYTTLVGLLYQIPVRYVFETSTELINLPPLPVSFDQPLFRRIEPLLARIERETSISQNLIQKELVPADRDAILALLEEEGDQFTMSALGSMIYQRYRTPSKLMPSPRNPESKDHTRSLSEEPHRSQVFELFKDRLAKCDWVDEFWYLRGSTDQQRQISRVGDLLHITCGGVVLKVKTTATEDSHYAKIIEEIRSLL